jgi:PAS domain S-box-containing protein
MTTMASRLEPAFLAEILTAISSGIITMDEEGTIVFATSSIEEHLGYEPADVVDEPISRLLPEDSSNSLDTITSWAEENATGSEREQELSLIHREGHDVRVTVTAERISHETRSVIVLRLSDDTEAKKPKTGLAEARSHFQKTFKYTTNPLMIIDPREDTIRECNDAICELLNYEREELLSRGPSDIHPHEMDTFEEFVESTFEEGESWTDELSCLTADGEEIPSEVSGTLLKLGDRRHMLIRVRDISVRKQRERERRETQELFEKTFEYSNDAIFIIDPAEDEFRDVNPRACELLDYSREELLSLDPSDIHPHEIERFRNFVEKVLDEGAGWTNELSCYTCNEEVVPAEMSMSRIELDGRPHILASVRDIAERKEYERRLEALNEASRELLQADTEQDVAEIAVKVIQEVLDRSLTALWTVSDEADATALRPLAASDDLTTLADSSSPADGVSPLQPGTAEMAAFRGGTTQLLSGYENLETPAHPSLPLQSRLVVPLNGHGVLTVGATDDEEIDAAMQDLVDIVAQSARVAFERLDREQALRYRSTAIEAAIDGMAILDEEQHYVYVNKAHADMYGYDAPDDLLGEPMRTLYDEAETERFRRDIMPALFEQGHWRGEAIGMRADGTTFPQEVSLASLDDGGLVCIVRDITEQKTYEERLEALNEASRDLTQAETEDEVAATGLQAVQDILGFDVVTVRLFDEEENTLEPIAMTDAAEELVASKPAFDLEATIAGHAYRQAKVVNTAAEGVSFGTGEQVGLHLPLGDYGVLSIFTDEDDTFEDAEVSLMEALAASIRAAIGRADREQTLRHNQRELRQQHEQLDTLYRITTLVQEIGKYIVEASTKTELERTVCEQIVASELYESAWIGEVEPSTNSIEVEVGAGVDEEYLAALDDMPLSMLGSGTVETAIDTGDTQVFRQFETEEGMSQTEVESTAAVPLQYLDRIYGILVVNGVRPDVFNENAVAGFESLGKLVGFAVTALRNRKILISDNVVDLELTVSDPTLFYTAVTRELDCRCLFQRSVPVEGGQILNYHLFQDADVERVLETARDATDIVDAQVVTERKDGFVLQTETNRSLNQLALRVGATLRAARFADGEAEITLEAPQSVDVRDIVEAFDESFGEVTLVKKRERQRAVQTTTEFRERVMEKLTEKQRTALEAAYAAGYYNWPRDTTAEDLAQSMNVSSSTLHQHLRHAVQTLTSAFLEEPQESRVIESR